MRAAPNPCPKNFRPRRHSRGFDVDPAGCFCDWPRRHHRNRGRFDPIEGRDLIRACLDRLEKAVDFVHTETLKGMNAGKDIWTLMREVQLPPELYVGTGYGKVSWAVRTIWESYMGWFKAQATSD